MCPLAIVVEEKLGFVMPADTGSDMEHKVARYRLLYNKPFLIAFFTEDVLIHSDSPIYMSFICPVNPLPERVYSLILMLVSISLPLVFIGLAYLLSLATT